MRICVLYVGQLPRTLGYFNDNILRNNEDVHVHACFSFDDLSTLDIEDQLRKEMGGHLKTLTWFNEGSDIWKKHMHHNMDDLLCEILKDKGTDHYNTLINLVSNGKIMAEYYQLYLAHNNMIGYELQNNFVYDFVIKIRTDVIFLRPIDFHWLEWTDDEIIKRKIHINELLTSNGMEATEYLVNDYFMNTILHDDLLKNISGIQSSVLCSNLINIDAHFLKTGLYILTFNNNLIYIINRHYFTKIPFLGITYGKYKCEWSDESLWWDPKNQFQSICYYSNLIIFNHEISENDDIPRLYIVMK